MGACCSKGVLSRVSVSPLPDEGPTAHPAAPHASQGSGPGHLPAGYSAKRRGSVSAEPSGAASGALKRFDPSEQPAAASKPCQSREKIQDLVRNTLLFRELDDDQQAAIIDAMFERRVAAGEVVIRQGEEADNFYVIEAGRFEATKLPSAGADGAAACGPAVRVATYEGRGSFGEMALMYNCPRAASVTALVDGVLWGVDRSTFRALVVHSMAERRQRYEATLRGMAVFRHLTQEQLAAVADCLHQEVFEAGEYILWEGAPLDDSAKLYIIESGRVDCFRTFEGRKRAVKALSAGDVFGEVALLTKAPRQADCVAASRCKCLTLSRDAFERLMGPVEQSLAQQIAAYAQSNAEALAVAAAAAACTAVDRSVGTAGPCQRAPTPPPACACSSRGTSLPTHAGSAAGSAAALLPGSPRPRAHSSDQSSPGGYSWRRSRRGTGSEAGDSPGSQCASPLASLLTSHDAPRGAPEGAAIGGEAADGEGLPEPLPTIAEETTLDAAGAAAAAAAAAEFAQERAAAAAAAAAGRSGKAAPRAAKAPAATAAGRKSGVAKKKVAAAYKTKQTGR